MCVSEGTGLAFRTELAGSQLPSSLASRDPRCAVQCWERGGGRAVLTGYAASEGNAGKSAGYLVRELPTVLSGHGHDSGFKRRLLPELT